MAASWAAGSLIIARAAAASAAAAGAVFAGFCFGGFEGLEPPLFPGAALLPLPEVFGLVGVFIGALR
jgi:hypothetical protein